MPFPFLAVASIAVPAIINALKGKGVLPDYGRGQAQPIGSPFKNATQIGPGAAGGIKKSVGYSPYFDSVFNARMQGGNLNADGTARGAMTRIFGKLAGPSPSGSAVGPYPPAGSGDGGSGSGSGGSGISAPSYNFNPHPWVVTEPERQDRMIQALQGIQDERGGFEDQYLKASARGGLDSRSGAARKYYTDMLTRSMGQEADVRSGGFLNESTDQQRHDELIGNLFGGLESSKMGATGAFNSLNLAQQGIPMDQMLALARIFQSRNTGTQSGSTQRDIFGGR